MYSFNFILLASSIFGSCIGSFLNVCILRIPRDISIAFPPSSCTNCKEPIKWYDNIPVLSYIFLLGRCRNCKTKISIQYPLVELFTGLTAFYTVFSFSLTLKAFFVFIFACVLIVISIIDLHHQIIPDIISLPGIPFFFILALILNEIELTDLVLGILLGGGILYLIAFLYYFLAKKEGMGGGDIKLLAMIGGFIGYKGVFFTIFVSSVLGTVIGIFLILLKGRDMKYAVPFGPFLSLGALIYIYFGDLIIFHYINFIRG
ncbi:MAG: prepilin peptidase [Desulfobacteraceae bacterium]|nr:prepilin peptidase [Desulfobacteraceae bacterium]